MHGYVSCKKRCQFTEQEKMPGREKKKKKKSFKSLRLNILFVCAVAYFNPAPSYYAQSYKEINTNDTISHY